MSAKILKNPTEIQTLSLFQLPEISEIAEVSVFTPHEISASSDSAEILMEDFAEEEVPIVPSAAEIIEEAYAEAERIIAQAERDKDAIEEAAREKGQQEARQIIEAEMNQANAELRQNLTQTIEEISALREQIVANAEVDLVKLALEISKKIVGREVTIDREIVLTLIKVSLKKLHSHVFAKVHLHSDDFAYVQNHLAKVEFQGTIQLVEDNSISQGGCLISTDSGDIDGRIESQFAEIAQGLLGGLT